MRLWLDAMWGIIRRDAILFVSYRTQLVSQFLGPLFSITLFYYISHLLTAKSIHSPGGYFGFVIIGLVIVQILTISMGVMPVTVRQELVSGTIERFLVSAHGPINGIIGTMLFPLINAVFSGIVMLALAASSSACRWPHGVPRDPRGAARQLAFMPFAFFLGSACHGVQAGLQRHAVHRRRHRNRRRPVLPGLGTARVDPLRPKSSRSLPPPICCGICWSTRRWSIPRG